MYVCSRQDRTWVELTEDIMRPYVAWKTGCAMPDGKRVKTEGFASFIRRNGRASAESEAAAQGGKDAARGGAYAARCDGAAERRQRSAEVASSDECSSTPYSKRRKMHQRTSYFFNPF